MSAPDTTSTGPGTGSGSGDDQQPEVVDETDTAGIEGGEEEDAGGPALDERAAQVEHRLRRVLADLDNLRKRFEREVARERSGERARTVAAWLPVVDDLERALGAGTEDAGPVIEGVRAVHEHALAVLERLGFPRFDDVGAQFDPVRHEAVSATEADAPTGTVVATVRPGYGREDMVLRPAAVVVSKS
ncbi:MAG: putative GrpE heat shock protein [Acidimicrobiales bacterium]|nr:putative GrpE heat shock protein [Acidimicrobiales bacterium]